MFATINRNGRPVDRLAGTLNELMDEFWTGGNLHFQGQSSRTGINLYISEEGGYLTASIPGVDPEKLEITYEKDHLTLKAEKNEPEFEESYRTIRREREGGIFYRKVRIPYRVDAEKIQANFKNGLVSVELPRKEEDLPRRIEVKKG